MLLGAVGSPEGIPGPILIRFWRARDPTQDDFESISALISVNRRSHAILSFLCLMCFVFQGLEPFKERYARRSRANLTSKSPRLRHSKADLTSSVWRAKCN